MYVSKDRGTLPGIRVFDHVMRALLQAYFQEPVCLTSMVYGRTDPGHMGTTHISVVEEVAGVSTVTASSYTDAHTHVYKHIRHASSLRLWSGYHVRA